MSVTERFYGAHTAGTNRPIQDFGLSDLNGLYQYTAKLRVKGLLVVVFWSPESAPSVRALEMVQAWTTDLPTQKWTALGVAGTGDRAALNAWAEGRELSGLSLLLDHELYQTRMWGVSHLPSVYLVSGKTGRVLQKILGENADALTGMRQALGEEIDKIIAGEAAAKAAEEEKKAADEAKKAEDAKNAEKK